MKDPEFGLSDTPARITAMQVELVRGAGPRRRAAITLAMTTAAVKLSRRAIARAHPEMSELEVKLLWAEIHYGKDLADRVRVYLAKHGKL